MRDAIARVDQEETIALPWLWLSLKRQSRWVIGGLLLGILLGVGLVLLAPPRYEAEAKVLVEPPTGVMSSMRGGLATLIGGGNPDVNTQVEILRSRPLLEQVYQAYRSEEPFRDFIKRFDTKQLRNTPIISLSASEATPEKSAKLTNLWVERYLAYVQDFYDRNPSTLVAKLSTELQQKEAELQAQSQKMVAFLKKKQMVVPDKEIAKALEKYADLQMEILNQQGKVQALTRQIADLRAELKKQPPYFEAGRNLAIPPEVQQLNSKIAELSIQRRALLEEYLPNTPEVQAIEAQIEQARQEREKLLAKAIDQQFLTLSKQEAVNPVYQGILEALWKAEVERNALQATLGYLKTRQSEMDRYLQRTPELLAEYADLRRQYEAGITLWTEKVKAYESARAQQLVGKVSPILLEPATPPERPTAPRPVLYTLTSATLGLMLGLLTAILIGLRDRRVETRWDLDRLLGVPVLAELSAQPTSEQLRLILWSLRAWGGGEHWYTVMALPLGNQPQAQKLVELLADHAPTASSPSNENLPAPTTNGVLRVRTPSESSLMDAERLLLVIPKGYRFEESTLLTLQQAQSQIVGAVLVNSEEAR